MTQLAPPLEEDLPGRAELAAADFLARYQGRTLDAYRHDLRAFFQWAADTGLDVLAQRQRPRRSARRDGRAPGADYEQAVADGVDALFMVLRASTHPEWVTAPDQSLASRKVSESPCTTRWPGLIGTLKGNARACTDLTGRSRRQTRLKESPPVPSMGQRIAPP